MLKHDELPFTVTSDGQLRYLTGYTIPASPEVLLLVVLIKEIQALNKKLDMEAETTNVVSAQFSQSEEE